MNETAMAFSAATTSSDLPLCACAGPGGFCEIRERAKADVFSLLLSRTHEGPKAVDIDEVIKAAEDIASGRRGPHYIVKVIRSKL